MMDDMQSAAVPAETREARENIVAMKTMAAPSASKFNKSHRLLVQKLYHIWGKYFNESFFIGE